jgi:hypothetical protein
VLKLSQKRSSKTTKKRTRKRLYNITGEQALTTPTYHQIRIKKSSKNRRKSKFTQKLSKSPRKSPENQKSAKNSNPNFSVNSKFPIS